jgi:drug/metabolite transporter (DMT)-like permease
MMLGTFMHLPLAAPSLAAVPWHTVSIVTWGKLVYSAVFAICVAYTIWYAAVREIGSARTSVYSNLLPIVAMITAWAWLHEPIGVTKILGAACVLAGVAVTKRAHGSGRTHGPGLMAQEGLMAQDLWLRPDQDKPA